MSCYVASVNVAVYVCLCVFCVSCALSFQRGCQSFLALKDLHDPWVNSFFISRRTLIGVTKENQISDLEDHGKAVFLISEEKYKGVEIMQEKRRNSQDRSTGDSISLSQRCKGEETDGKEEMVKPKIEEIFTDLKENCSLIKKARFHTIWIPLLVNF